MYDSFLPAADYYIYFYVRICNLCFNRTALRKKVLQNGYGHLWRRKRRDKKERAEHNKQSFVWPQFLNKLYYYLDYYTLLPRTPISAVKTVSNHFCQRDAIKKKQFLSYVQFVDKMPPAKVSFARKCFTPLCWFFLSIKLILKFKLPCRQQINKVFIDARFDYRYKKKRTIKNKNRYVYLDLAAIMAERLVCKSVRSRRHASSEKEAVTLVKCHSRRGHGRWEKSEKEQQRQYTPYFHVRTRLPTARYMCTFADKARFNGHAVPL